MKQMAHGQANRSLQSPAPAKPSANKRSDTKELLMTTAERLFGRHGLDGISLREIAAAAGQANSNVVQYHFTDKAGLIRAILENRVNHLETLRGEHLQNLSNAPSVCARELLKILWLPAMTIIAADGSHTFCRFLLQYLLHPHNVKHPLVQLYAARGDQNPSEKNLSHLIKATHMLRDLYAALPEHVLNRRLSALSLMFLATVVEHDNVQLGDDAAKEPLEIELILDMAIAALNAPA